MWPTTKTYLIFIALICVQSESSWGLSDKRLCADPKCQEIISLARGAIRYTAAEEGMVSFNINAQIRVLSKSAGSNPNLWGVEIAGRRGYAPKEFLREEKILIKDKDLLHIVPVIEPKAKRSEDKQGVALKNQVKSDVNPSEIRNEEKLQPPSEITTTAPLNEERKEVENTPSLLNASEIGLEATTAPLTAPIVNEETKIINQSLREMATPVQEIIDGTAIPFVQEAEVKLSNTPMGVNPSEKSDENLKELNTKKDESMVNPSIDNDKKTVDSTNGNSIEVEEFIEPRIASINNESSNNDNKEKIVVESKTTESENVLQPIGQIEHLSKEENIVAEIGSDEVPKPLKVEQSKDTNDKDENQGVGSETKSPSLLEKSDENVEKLVESNDSIENKSQTDKEPLVTSETKGPSLADVVGDKMEQLTQSNASENEQLPSSKENYLEEEKVFVTASNKDLPLSNLSASEGNNDFSKSTDTVVENLKTKQEMESNNTDKKDETKQTPIVESKEVLKDKAPEFSINDNTGFFTGPRIEDDDDDSGIDDDDDDDEDLDDEDIEDEMATQKTPKSVTDSGYERLPENARYWEDVNIDMTTPSPKVSEDAKEFQLNTPQNNVPETVDPVASAKTATILPELVESTTPSNQVPSMPTTLPLFRQDITFPSTNTQVEDSSESMPSQDPNEYYRMKALEEQQTQNPSHPELPIEENTKEASHPSETIEHHINTATQSSSEQASTVPPEPTHHYYGTGSVEMITTPSPMPEQEKEIPSIPQRENEKPDERLTTPSSLSEEETQTPSMPQRENEKPEAGLFSTILGTVNSFVGKLKKDQHKNDIDSSQRDEDLERILYPERFAGSKQVPEDNQYCLGQDPHLCPQQPFAAESSSSFSSKECYYDWSQITSDNFLHVFASKAIEMRELLACLAIVSTTSLLFLFGYYCFCNSSREGALLSKLNLMERSLLASHKENAILKDDLLKTRNKLTSIEDNSFGSNDMVIAVKKELDVIAEEKRQLQEHVHSLEKELETAAEAGLELNKIVAELLNNQSGQESMIMNSVEDLQMQFNQQQKTIFEINANLAEKSRENSELQLMLAEQNVRFSGEIASLQQDNDELEAEKSNLQSRLEELKAEFEEDITKALEGKNVEIKRLQNEIGELNNRYEDMRTKWQTSLAKIEALEDCMKTLKKDPAVNVKDIINVANVKAELLDLQQQRTSLKSRLNTETEARQHAEEGLKSAIEEVDKLKQDFHQSEKDKLEAQTRLEVLSNYFKEKETQLQKELSLKEAVWLKQQGENTSTVDRMTALQEEIQSLKSQNDALRAEIEAQLAAHKAQTGTLENRAHETWLAARQSERRYEEARAEAAALRRRLTELAGGNTTNDGSRAPLDGIIQSNNLNNAPSPIMPPPLMDTTASSPLLGRLPPPPQFLPFMGPPPPFLNLPPPPPFLSSAEIRPAPLGRMMSPPLARYSPVDDDDYDDDGYDYDDDDDEESPRHRRHHHDDSNWRRERYSPPPPDRSYRSHSPSESRFNYTTDRDLMSTYDTETDLSPPPSPRERRGTSRTGSYHAYSPHHQHQHPHHHHHQQQQEQHHPKATSSSHVASKDTSSSSVNKQKTSKGIPNSDSEKSSNSAQHYNKKGKSLV